MPAVPYPTSGGGWLRERGYWRSCAAGGPIVHWPVFREGPNFAWGPAVHMPRPLDGLEASLPNRDIAMASAAAIDDTLGAVLIGTFISLVYVRL